MRRWHIIDSSPILIRHFSAQHAVLRDNTIAHVIAKAGFPSVASDPIVFHALYFYPVPGDASSEEYENSAPDMLLPVAPVIGHVSASSESGILPKQFTVATTSYMQDMINFVFPDDVLADPLQCVTRAILAPTNAQIDAYNEHILCRIQGLSRQYMSADSLQEGQADDDEDASSIPYSSVLDYVASHPPTGMPPAKLTVKVGAVYRIMRNFSVERGLVKNACVLVTDLGVRLISVRLLKDTFSMENEDILLPRITFSSRLPSGHTLIRKQFPLAPAYATTFNSCQGLTLDIIGMDLTKPVFSHGQLYTALSRVRKREHVLIYIHEQTTRNVTYKELLI